MNVAFDGIGAVMATFLTEEDVTGGEVVKVTANGTVGLCSEGDAFFGVALVPTDGAAAVQVSGFMTVHCDSGVPALGYVTLCADGNGGIKTAASGTAVQVVAVDETNLTAVIYL